MGPRGLPGGRFGRQKTAWGLRRRGGRGAQGEKWPILVTVSVSRGPPRGPGPENSEDSEDSECP